MALTPDDVPAWLRDIKPGDPIELTIRGVLTEKILSADGEHVLMSIRYGNPQERASQFDGPDPVLAAWPPPDGLTLRGFILTPTDG
jgi:hypothetical protein